MFFEFFTTGAGWVLAAFASVMLMALVLLLNQYFKQPGNFLVFWSRIFTVLILTPGMFFVDWPSNPLFYVAVGATALCAAFGDIRIHNIVSQYGGGVVSRAIPLNVFLTFPLWFLFDSSLLQSYLGDPLRTFGIFLSLVGVVYFSMNLRKCNVSNAAFKALLPVLLCYTVNWILNKYTMGLGSYDGVVFCYMYIQSIVVVPLVGGYLMFARRRKDIPFPALPDKRLLLAAALLSFCWVGSMTFKNTAMITVPNPAYIAAMGQMAPVLISLLYKAIGHKEEADVLSGFGIVLCAIIMTLLTV